MDKDFILKIDEIIAMTYKGSYGNYDTKMQKTWYNVENVQWYTCEDKNNFYICIQGSRSNQDDNKDLIDNLDFKQTKFFCDQKIKIHKGHARQAGIVFDKIKEFLGEPVVKNNTYIWMYE